MLHKVEGFYPIQFTLDELIYLHSVVRADGENKGLEFPEWDFELNQSIVEGLLLIKRNVAETSATLQLSFKQLIALDHVVKWGAKNFDGKAVGTAILYKVFEARDALKNYIGYPDAPEVEEQETIERLNSFKKENDASNSDDSSYLPDFS